MSMFCHQCQEAAKGVGCSIVGVCGKKEDVSNLQDLLLYSLKGIAIFRSLADENFRKENGEHCDQLDRFIVESLFMTITNANFDKNVFVNQIKEALDIREKLKAKAKELGFTDIKFSKHDAANFIVETEEEMEAKAISIGWMSVENEDIRSLQSLILYGVKGMAAYYEHAVNLGKKKKDLVMFMEKALLATIDSSLSVDDLVALTMETGKYSVDVMALLDEANTSTYGNPEITEVNIGVKKNPGILISGHDLKDLEMLLEQTKGTGIDVYTHGEMLPANYYPFFKKYDNLVGNYGNAWWQQKSEMEAFNGPILFTTNCIVPPSETYKDRVYTTGASGFEGCTHFEADENGHKDFSAIIEHAKKCEPPKELEKGSIVGGFAHSQVIALADKVVGAVKSGAIKRFVVMAGCDGRHKTRQYYTDVAKTLPKDSVILTAGCAKYRYNKLNLGDIDGIPRVLDAGQCNDSYSLAVIALKLKEVFELEDINELPISFDIAWYEQKAVTVLLALLYLGVKGIRLGPTLPAFLSPNVAKVLVENFDIKGIGTVEEDVKAMMEGK